LVTGVIVSALGFGGVVFTPIVEKLIETFGGVGEGEQKTFMILSAVFLIVCTFGSLFLKSPHGEDKKAIASASAAEVKNYTPSEMIKTPRFYIILITFMLACMGGLMVINFARPIASASSNETVVRIAMVGVLTISMFNSVGRLIWGMISDKLGRINTICVLLAGNAVLSLLVVFVADSLLLYVLLAFIGFFYGGFLSNFPALTGDLFGLKHNATNYGFVLLGFGSGAIIASQIAGYFRNIAAEHSDIGRMFPAFVIASCCALTGIILMLVLKRLDSRAKKN
jgi:OFA family oxalate/formate antiporter-like MFS transporter